MNMDNKQDGITNEYEKHIAENGGDYRVKNSKIQNAIAKVLCVLAALVLWFYVASANTVVVERTFTGLPVTIRNREVLSAKDYGEVIRVNNSSVDITLRGSKAALEQLSVDDIVMYVDVGSVSGTGEQALEILASLPSGITIVEQSPSLLDVYIDKICTKRVKVELDLQYTMENADYYIDEDGISLSEEWIEISGPAEELEKVAGARLTLKLGDSVDSSKSTVGKPVLVDSTNTAITSQYITMKTTSVKVIVPVYMEKDVALAVKFKNGYLVNGENVKAKIQPDTIRLKGDPVILKGIEEIYLDTIDETGIIDNSPIEKEIRIPDGIEKTSQGADKATVVLTHIGTRTATVSLTVDDCEPNAPGPYTYTAGGTVEIEFRIPDSLLVGTTAKELIGDDDVEVSVAYTTDAVTASNRYPLTVEVIDAELRGKVYPIYPEDGYKHYINVQKNENITDNKES